ncbi:MAG: zinc-ribbon domain-containing protein [Chloroflexi bacterium]|nr:MAG: zinc-ribbon domain-containing protein [Chloroflexota bacterium]
MLCPSCNTSNRDDAKFCKSCGRSFSVSQPEDAINRVPTPSSSAQYAPTAATSLPEDAINRVPTPCSVIS